MYDYLIKNATIADGTGKKSFPGSLLVKGEAISKIITGGKLPAAKKTIDAKGLVLAPGFIDMHTHNDWLLPDPGNAEVLEPLIRQGVTTVVTGQCGTAPAPVFSDHADLFDWVQDVFSDQKISLEFPTLESFFKKLEKNGIALNMAHFIGHGTLSLSLKGEAYRRGFTPEELKRMAYAIDESFDAGAFGMSFGLGYPPGIYSGLDELKWFAARAGKKGLPISVHLKALAAISPVYPYIPGGTPHNIIALREMLEVARHAGTPLQISHLIFVGKPSWIKADSVIELIEKERSAGVDIAFDAFPYRAGNTAMVALVPSWFWKNFDQYMKKPLKIKLLWLNYLLANSIMGFDVYGETRLLETKYEPFIQYQGKKFAEIARELGKSNFETYLLLLEKTRAMARVLIPGYYDNEDRGGILARVLSHPFCLFETDSIISRNGFQNPATYGNFPKILGTFTRDMKLMTIEESIRKMTGASAERMGIRKRGVIAEGNYADLVLLDYDRIAENPEPNKPAVGIQYVFINGRPVVKKGLYDRKARMGRVLRRNE